MNDILNDVSDLESAVDCLKKLDHTPDVINAIIKIDDIIERKKTEFNDYEKYIESSFSG
ncbi:hypothetical protein N9V27_00700 [bacterium]|jgi:hypothetical protein|nr:hypothetical protein [bacterium]|tara:strand:- start:208 stop:384 length:177 start_codon:yes stop_codon:yes gene_type:complete